jgi:putative transposase
VLPSLAYSIVHALLDRFLVRVPVGRARDAELLALRHEVRVLRRRTKRVPWRPSDLWGREMLSATWGSCAASCGAMLAYRLLVMTFARAVIGSRADLAVENLLLRQQLAVLTRPTRKRPRRRPLDRLFWVLARRLRGDWRQHLLIVRPETVIRWHRQGWRRYRRWKSRPRLGRPRLGAEAGGLIRAMAQDNPRWGSERIRGEPLKLGIAVSKRSVQRYRRRGPARPPSQTWRTFLANHAGAIWAADLCPVQTLTFKTL